MGGINPYIEKPKFSGRSGSRSPLSTKNGQKKDFAVDPSQIPFGRTGLEGSILDIAFGAGVEIDHSCGGVCACATCHVHVREGLGSCGEATDDELDQLDSARELTLESRLSCQCVPNGTQDRGGLFPRGTRIWAKEGH